MIWARMLPLRAAVQMGIMVPLLIVFIVFVLLIRGCRGRCHD